MRFEGVLLPPKKGEKYWSVAVPALGIYSQGKNRADALFMICDAVECSVERKGFRISVEEEAENGFSISANDPKVLLSLLLERKRSEAGLSIREVARRLKMKSPNGYAKYERGEVSPSVDQFEKLLHAIDPKAKVFLKVG